MLCGCKTIGGKKEIEKKMYVCREKKKEKKRTEQDSNLRGQSPLDFESNALTTRPSVLQLVDFAEM